MVDSRGRLVGVVLAIALLLALSAAAIGTSSVLISTLGIVVVTAGLVLPLRDTALVAVLALSLAIALGFVSGDESVFRVINVGIGSLLGVGAAWSRTLSVQRIEGLVDEERTLLASVTDAVLMLDASGRVVRTNPALDALVPDATPGTEIHPLLHHRRADGSACPGGCPLSGRLPDGTGTIVDGEWLAPRGVDEPVEYSVAPITTGGVAISIRSRSDRLRVEQEREARLSAEAAARDQQRVLRDLGATLTPTIPAVREIEMDVWSRPAEVHTPTGGDLLDTWVREDGRLVVILVDALGHGIGSVRDGWKVLYASKSYLTLGLPLAEVVTRTAALVASDPQPPVATLLAATIDPSTGEVEVAGGGHPPPLVLRAEGSGDWLDIPGRGVGTPDARSDATITTTLGPGDSIVFYTDGLVEARRDVVAGMLGMRASALALRKEPPAGWAHRLVDAVLGDSTAPDDTVVLLVRRTTPAAPAPRRASGRPVSSESTPAS